MFLRTAGWFIFLIGVAVFAVLGEMSVRTFPGKVGVFTMVGGMMLSTTATILQHLTEYRNRQRRIAELRTEREPTKPPDPPPPPAS